MMLFVLFWPFKTFGGSHCTKGSLKYLKLGFYGFFCRNLYILQKKQRSTFQATTLLSHQYMTPLDSTAHSIRFIMTWSSDLVVFLFVRQTLKLDTVSKVCRMLRIVLKLVTQTVSLQCYYLIIAAIQLCSALSDDLLNVTYQYGQIPTSRHGWYNGTLFPNSNASFACRGGYRLEGSTDATCQADGQWNYSQNKTPTCKSMFL